MTISKMYGTAVKKHLIAAFFRIKGECDRGCDSDGGPDSPGAIANNTERRMKTAGSKTANVKRR